MEALIDMILLNCADDTELIAFFMVALAISPETKALAIVLPKIAPPIWLNILFCVFSGT